MGEGDIFFVTCPLPSCRRLPFLAFQCPFFLLSLDLSELSLCLFLLSLRLLESPRKASGRLECKERRARAGFASLRIDFITAFFESIDRMIDPSIERLNKRARTSERGKNDRKFLNLLCEEGEKKKSDTSGA